MNKPLQGCKVLVAGAAGFVGANLIRKLKTDGAHILALVRNSTDLKRLQNLIPPGNMICIDLLDNKMVTRKLSGIKPEFVFNMVTARDMCNWQNAYQTNTMAAYNFALAVNSPQLRRLIHFGSSTEYGHSRSVISEKSLLKPDSFYGASKAAGTILLRQLAAQHSIPIVILRPFYVYGDLEAAHRFIPQAIDFIHQNKTIPVTRPGIMHDFVYIDDVIRASYQAAINKRAIGEIINLSSGVETSNEAIIACLSAIMGKSAKVQTGGFDTRPWDSPNCTTDNTLAETVLAWKAEISLKKGLTKCVDLYNAGLYTV